MPEPKAASPSSSLHPSILGRLQRRTGSAVARVVRLSGGSVHQAYRVWLGDDRSFFLKTSAHTSPRLFATEAEGLRWLAGFAALRTPAVLAVADQRSDESGFLALEWIPHTPPTDVGFARFGFKLAELHCHGQLSPGWQRAGFIGPLPQLNGGEALTWPEFWAERRIREMLVHARKMLPDNVVQLVDLAASHTDEIIGKGRPLAPLHGDLWHGNVIFHDDEPVLVDPAVYIGDPEVDLAMLALFGGMGPAFWRSYHTQLAVEPGFERRQAMYQLWPQLVHVAIFGGGYVSGVESCARRALAD